MHVDSFRAVGNIDYDPMDLNTPITDDGAGLMHFFFLFFALKFSSGSYNVINFDRL